ncbi:acyl--CoA ligase [Rhizobacter sp. J219]|uniref:class I adenylate-forming enzyme family protein n=1 Tax=Rhizobacter sp. J219 TaxID=2898430 RepID=UPI0021507991|nr:class I adenylate-forming enzyme family protein [Rhizobacter sp. J219]MCR5882619.1 acyl--CoA ligase [Rhizobacter sp. J219]
MLRAQAIAELTSPGQPGELVDIVAHGRQVKAFKNAPSTLRDYYGLYVTDLPFLIYEDERYTFREAWQQASRIGHALVHQCGVKPGDRVAISMRNYPEWMIAFSAITSIGAIAVAMNAHWQADDMAYALVDCGAKVLLADQERLDRLAQKPVKGLQVLAVRATELRAGARDLKAVTASLGNVPMPPVAMQPDDLAIMLYTSGSSGRPKGVPSTHRMVISALLSWELDYAILDKVNGVVRPEPAEQGGTLLAVPLFHVTGLHSSYLGSYRLQRRLASMYRWDAEKAAELIDRERLTSLTGPAAVTGDLIRVAQSGRYSLATLASLGGGGAPRAPEQVRQIDASFTQAIPNIGWGMTETNAIGAGIVGQDYLDHPSSSGHCSQVLELRVTDESGRVLPPGERGELWVRGTSVFTGYWNNPDANKQSFDGDWFRTGDGATIDAEGYLYIVDRLKDLIIRGGENIGCGAVEAALLMHPEVIEASVYAVPDERLGEEVGATVYGTDKLDVDELRRFLEGHLAKFEIPRYIERAHAPLPRTPSGKILKREIKQAAIARLKT